MNKTSQPSDKLNCTYSTITAMHNGADWQDDGAKKDTMGLEKSMNGANLPVFLKQSMG